MSLNSYTITYTDHKGLYMHTMNIMTSSRHRALDIFYDAHPRAYLVEMQQTA